MRVHSFLFVLTLLALLSQAAAAQTSKYAVVIGNNVGIEPEKALRYAESDAQKLYDVLIDNGGFDKQNSALILGENADGAWQRIKRVERKVAAQKRKGSRVVLLVYFSGHAEGDTLQLGETGLRFEQLRNYLQQSKADVRLAFLDSCKSGSIISERGGRRGPSFDIRVSEEISSKGYAIITSSAHDEVSQETSELRGGYFTHYLVSALRGAGDESGDGQVTLDEAYRYTYSRTTARTSLTMGGAQHPMYQFKLEGKGDIVLASAKGNLSRLAIRGVKKGRLVLLDEEGKTLVAESDVDAGGGTELVVRPGRYTVYYVNDADEVYSTKAKCNPGQRVVINKSEMRARRLKRTVQRGGLFSTPEGKLHHRLAIGGIWRSFPLDGAQSSLGGAFSYRLTGRRGYELLVVSRMTTRSDVGVSTGYRDFGASLGGGYRWRLHPLIFRTGIEAGVDFMLQDDYEGQSRSTAGFGYGAGIGVEMPLGAGLFVALDGRAGGRMFKVIDAGLVHRFDAIASLSLGWFFSSKG